jgi:hypothetical protein
VGGGGGGAQDNFTIIDSRTLKKKVSDFPVPSRYVHHQTLPGGNN